MHTCRNRVRYLKKNVSKVIAKPLLIVLDRSYINLINIDNNYLCYEQDIRDGNLINMTDVSRAIQNVQRSTSADV